MGVCCCKSSVVYSQPAAQSLDHKDEVLSSTSPTGSNTVQPMLGENKLMTDGHDNDMQQISEMALCDDDTSSPCTLSINLIRALSIYHSFVNKYNEENTNNICNRIYDTMNGYNIINLRNDYHHTITYHESNNTFMKSLFIKLMDLNHKNDISNLQNITQSIDCDQEERTYFHHIMDEEIKMIQTLNQIHYDITSPFMKSDNDAIDDDTDDGACSVNEIDSDDTNKQITTDDDDDDDHMMNNKMKMNKKGYTKSKTNDDDDDDDDIDEDMKKTKIMGRLRKKSRGKQKIMNDDHWMDSRHKKSRKHHVSESIQMLGNTQLVSRNSFKELQSMGALEEKEFDLTSFDADNMDIDSDDKEI